MASTLDDYRRKLIDKILLSASPRDARRFGDAAIRGLQEHNVHGYIIVRFIEKTLYNLEELSALSADERQLHNIRIVTDHFRQIKKRFMGSAVS